MPTMSTFVCECGIRLNVVSEPQWPYDITVVPCPNPGCTTRYMVNGRVLQVVMVSNDGRLLRLRFGTRSEAACGVTFHLDCPTSPLMPQTNFGQLRCRLYTNVERPM